MSGCAQWCPARTQIALAAEDLGHVVGVDALQGEGDERAALRRDRAGRGA